MTGFLKVETFSNCIDSKEPEEQYGSWYTCYDSGVRGVTVGTATDYAEEVPFESKAGDTVYVVYVLYSSGDSFGHAEGQITIADVFRDSGEASTLAHLIESGSEQFDYINNGVKLTMHGYQPWHDYFGGLASVHVEAFVVK
jgi:hypothetical protein